MQKIGLIVAMDKELALVQSLLQNAKEYEVNGFKMMQGQLDGKQIMLVKSGIGKVCSALATAELIKAFKPEIVINTGAAGALDKKLAVGDVVVSSEVVYHDVFCDEELACGQMQGLPARYKAVEVALSDRKADDGQIHNGLMCSGDRFITSLSELKEIKAKFPEALAVDMESASVAQTCYLYQTPFISLRIISDTPGITDHHQQYKNFWDQAPAANWAVVRQLIENC